MLMKYNDQFKKLDDIGFVGRGKSKHRPRNDESLYGGEYPFVQTGDVRKAEYYLTDFTQTYNDKGLAQSKLWDEGTLCITIAANIAETAVLGIKACFPDSIIGFIPNEDEADVRFIKYCLETYKLQMQAISKGATQDNLSLEKLRSLNFLIPRVDEQRRIADVLYNYDKLIQNNTKRIVVLKQMAEELYKEWFVRMRFPNYENTKFVKGIPEGWEIVNVKSFGKVVTGKTPSTKVNEYYGDIYPFIKTPDMHKSIFAIQTEEKLTQRGFSSQPSQTLPEGSICVSCIGTAGVVSITNEVSMTNQQIHSLIPDNPDYLEFLYYTLVKLKPTIEMFGATGTTMTNLSKGKFEKLLVLKPKEEIILKYHEQTKQVFQEIKNLSQQNINLRKTRDLLLPRLISGKLKIQTEVEKQIEIQKPITVFYQKQILAHIINKQEEHKVPQGEMVLAKNTYLIDKIYGVHTGFNWENWHYGTYDGKIRTLINGRDRFFKKQEVGSSGYKVLVLGENKDKILDKKYHHSLLDTVDSAMEELLSIYAKYPVKERSHKIELLNTTCKAIADTQSVDSEVIQSAFKDWKTPKAKFDTKAQKFNPTETKQCIKFIVSKGWDKKLLD